MAEENKYSPFLPTIPKMGYFILYKRKEKDWIGATIEKKQLLEGFPPEASCFTHVETSGGGIHSIKIGAPRVYAINITKAHKGRFIRIVRYKNEDYEKKGRYKVAYFSAAMFLQKGISLWYDFRGILSFIFKWIKQNNRHFFCSENCLTVLQKEYPQALYGLKPSECYPANFCDENFFETVWEGIIP